MNSSTKITDLRFLIDFTKGNDEKIKRYIGMYLSSTPQVINEIESLFSESNIESLALKAHSIKPQVQYMGASRLSEVLLQIENICQKNHNTEQLPELISSARKLNEQVSKELSQFLQEM